jgi:hypothetical protein
MFRLLDNPDVILAEGSGAQHGDSWFRHLRKRLTLPGNFTQRSRDRREAHTKV